MPALRVISLPTAWRAAARFLLFFGLILLAGRALAFEAPAFQGDVLDETGTLSTEEQDTLRQRIRALRENSGVWAAVYVTKGLQGDSIENATVSIFEKWKLGQKGKDNGVLVLVVPSERKVRIEVGYGLEGSLTDVFCKRLIENVYKPAFRDQRFADGLMQGFDAMALAVKGEAPALAPPDGAAEPPQPELDGALASRLFGLTVMFNLLPAALYALAWRYGRSKGRTKGNSLWNAISTPLIVSGFLAVFFGIFIGVFGSVFAASPDEPPIVPILALVNAVVTGLFFLPSFLQARSFLSDAAYQRYQERKAASRSGSSSSPDDDGFWRDSSSSSSSFSDSSSSSSDGGSSGGGGSSGDW